MTINQLAEETGFKLSVLKKHLATMKKGRHWSVGRYKQAHLTPAGEAMLRELLSPAEPEPEVVEDVAPFVCETPNSVEVKLGANSQPVGTLADRMLDGHDTATVKMVRLPNTRLLLVEHAGKEVQCLCKDNRFFVPAMKIAVKWVGGKLASVFQPRKIGRW